MLELVLGGARSGKSALALARARTHPGAVCWIATATAGDAEMAARIARHRGERPAHWPTAEEPLYLAAALRRLAQPDRLLVVDCLTLWLANLMLATDPELQASETAALLTALPELPGTVLLVANEVGLGIVPEHALGRRFRDEAGRLNQALAARAGRVALVVAGLPLWLKGAPT